MVGTEPAREVPMLPRMIEMVVRIITAGVMPDPLIAVINVRGIWVPGLVAIIAVFLRSVPCTSKRSRPMGRNVPADFMLGTTTPTSLRKSRNGKDQQRHKKSNTLFHAHLRE
jgi:hypothetical protein